MAIDVQYYQKRSEKKMIFSGVFFVLVLLLTLGIYIFHVQIEKGNIQKQEELARLNTSIQELESQSEILSYKLYEQNKNVLKKMHCNSQITDFIIHLKRIGAKYNFSMQGFNYSDGKIQTQVTVKSDTSGNASDKIISFLREYPKDDSALFEIQPIVTVVGHNEISFGLQFILKDSYYETCK